MAESPSRERFITLSLLIIGSVAHVQLVLLSEHRGLPWVHTPLLFRFDNGQKSGLLGTMNFLGLGLLGLAVPGIGVTRTEQRRRQMGQKDLPGP